MTERDFITQNQKSWQELETLLLDANADTDRLQELFVKVSGDLSYARTYFPNRSTRLYLNGLLHRVFDSMRRDDRVSVRDKIIHFYSSVLPQKVIRYRYAFILSLVVFLLAMCIGVFSTVFDFDFAREILGNEYVEQTLANIDKNDPMAIYKDENKSMMFLGITVNNIKVAFLTFVSGIFASVGTVFILIQNGIMVGTFQTFFYEKNLLATSAMTIWIHGTIEILSIIIAGAAGMIMGSGILFPGSYSRTVSLRRTALDGLIIMLSVFPLFVVAGFLEGFVTRMTELPSYVKIAIILISFAIMLYIYVIHPYNYYRKGYYRAEVPRLRTYDNLVSTQTSSSLRWSLGYLIRFFGKLCGSVVVPVLILFGLLHYATTGMEQELGWIVEGLTVLVLGTTLVFWLGYVLSEEESNLSIFKTKLKDNAAVVMLTGFVLMLGYLMTDVKYLSYALVLFPLSGISKGIMATMGTESYGLRQLIEDIRFNYKYLGSFFFDHLVVVALYFLFTTAVVGSMIGRIIKMLSWHEISEDTARNTSFYSGVLATVILVIVTSFALIYLKKRFIDRKNIHEATDLNQRLDEIITEQKAVV